MKKTNYLTILIGIVAVVVILESIVLVSGLGRKVAVVAPTNNVVTTPVATGEAKKEPAVFDVLFSSKNSAMVVDESYPIEVNALAKAEETLDAISLFVKYDATAMDVSGLTFDKKLPNPTFQKISTTKGLVVVNYLVTGNTGLTVKSGDILSLVKFDVIPKKSGSFNLEISTGNELKESATMFVESGSNKSVAYSSNKLTVNVSTK